MTLSESIERLKAEKSYAEYALMHNPNDEKYKSLVEAIDTTRKFIDEFVCFISKFDFKEKGDAPQNHNPSDNFTPCCANTDSGFISPCELQVEELPFG